MLVLLRQQDQGIMNTVQVPVTCVSLEVFISTKSPPLPREAPISTLQTQNESPNSCGYKARLELRFKNKKTACLRLEGGAQNGRNQNWDLGKTLLCLLFFGEQSPGRTASGAGSGRRPSSSTQ